MRIAIVSTHPIQYNAPFFRLLASQPGIEVHVFYTWEQSATGPKFDPGFGRRVDWDIPLLEGYDYTFVKNTSRRPGSDHFWGIVNPGLNQEIESWGADAVLVYGWNFHSHLRCLRYFHRRIPVWFRGDSTLLNETAGLRRIIRRVLLKWVYRHVDLALYVGKHNKEYFIRHGLIADRLLYVPHAVDNSRFQHDSEKFESRARIWRNEIGIADDNIVILFAGKLEPRKNPAFLVEMAKHIESEAVRFLIVGNGPLEQIIQDWASKDHRVIRLGFQNQGQMPVIYRMGDIFVLPSQSETWGLGVNEAMACGRPVLISDHCGCAPDLVRDGINGFVFQFKNPVEASRKLNEMLHDRDNLRKMGTQSLQIIEAFSVDHEVNALVGYSQNLNARSAG